MVPTVETSDFSLVKAVPPPALTLCCSEDE